MDDFHSVSLAASPTRRVAIIATLVPPRPGNDLGGYGVHIELCPVVVERGEMFICRGNGCTTGAALGDRARVSIHACPWPEHEDGQRLEGKISALRLRLRLHAEYLRENGQLLHDAPRRTTPLPSGLLLVGMGITLAALWALALSRTSS
jgi:hypothetical protein